METKHAPGAEPEVCLEASELRAAVDALREAEFRMRSTAMSFEHMWGINCPVAVEARSNWQVTKSALSKVETLLGGCQ